MADTPQNLPSQSLSDQNLMPILSEDEIKEIAKAFSHAAFDVISSKLITSGLISKFSNDPFSQQLLLSILVFALLKQKNTKEAKKVYISFPFEKTKYIFPLIFLKAKMYIENKDYKNAVETLCLMKGRYESYNKDDTNADSVITLETYNSKFTYFGNIFRFLFAIDNLDSKIKKIIFELKNFFSSLSFINESYDLISALYNKYPNDIIVIYEYAKDSLTLTFKSNYENAIAKLKSIKESSSNEKEKKKIKNYLEFLDLLEHISKAEYEKARTMASEMKAKAPNNPIMVNNEAVLNIMCNKVEEGYNGLLNLAGRAKMDFANGVVKENMNILGEFFNIKYNFNP